MIWLWWLGLLISVGYYFYLLIIDEDSAHL